MKKVIFALMFILLLSSNCFAAQIFKEEDLYLHNCGPLQIYNKVNVNDASSILGEILDESYTDNGVQRYAYIIMEGGEIYIDLATNRTEAGQIGRLIATRQDVYTNKGITIGSKDTDLIKAYGTPGNIRLSNNEGTIKQWYLYFYKDGIRRIFFGLNYDNQVAAIGFSMLPYGI